MTRSKYSPSDTGDLRVGVSNSSGFVRRGNKSVHNCMYYPSDKTPPASARNRPPSFDFDTYSPPEVLAASFSSSGTNSSPEPNPTSTPHRSEQRSELLTNTRRPKGRGDEGRVDSNISKGAVLLRQQLLLDQFSPPRNSSSSRGIRDPSPSPRAKVDSSELQKPVQSNDMLLDIQDLEEQMRTLREHLHGPDYLHGKSPSSRKTRGSGRRRSRSRSRRHSHYRSKSGSSQNFDYSDLYQLSEIPTADSKLDMVIQAEVPALCDEESRIVPVDPPAEREDHHLESFDLGVDTVKWSSSDFLNALPSPQQSHATEMTSFSNETSATSPPKGARTRATPFAAGVCTPKSSSASSRPSDQNTSNSKSDLENDQGYQHALAAGTVLQTLLGEQIRFPKTWFDGERTPYLLGDDINKKGKWCYVPSVPVRFDRFLNKLILKNRTKPGRIILHVVVRDNLNWTPTRHIALGVYHPNARGIRETDDPVPGDESLRMVWMAVRRCTESLNENDAPYVTKETDLQRRIDTVLFQGGSFETNGQPSPLGGRHTINNGNVRCIYGDEAPLETVFVSQKELYAILIRAADDQGMQNMKAKFSVVLALLEQFVYQKRR